MNLALSTIVIVIIFSPGVAFIWAYETFQKKEKYFTRDWIAQIMLAVFPALLIHFVGIWLVNVVGKPVNFNVLQDLFFPISSPTNRFESGLSPLQNIYQYRLEILSYFLSTLTISFFLGYFFKFILITNQWYNLKKTEPFRVKNE